MLCTQSTDKTQRPCKAEIFDSLLMAPTYVTLCCSREEGQEQNGTIWKTEAGIWNVLPPPSPPGLFPHRIYCLRLQAIFPKAVIATTSTVLPI